MAGMRGFVSVIAIGLLAASRAAAAADEQPICADRPSKSTGPCTVPKGQWQVETGLIDWNRDKSDGVTTDATAWGTSRASATLAKSTSHTPSENCSAKR